MTEAEHDDDAQRYRPSTAHPGEWVCRDCPPPTGERVMDRAIHDDWHDAP